MKRSFHGPDGNGSGYGCSPVDCEYRDQCDRTGEHCRHHGGKHGPDGGRGFGPNGPHGPGEEHGIGPGGPHRPGEGPGFGPRGPFGPGEGPGFDPRGPHGPGEEHGFDPRGPHRPGEEHGFDPRGPHRPGEEHGFDPRGPHGPEEGHGFDPRRPHGRRGHAGRPGFPEDDSLRSLLIRAAQSMHHPRAGASQELVLRILEREGELDQRILRQELRIQPGSLSELLGKLEQKGLVERERIEADRRRVTVRLTESGRAALSPGEAAADDPFAVLTDEEQSVLRSLLEKLLSDDPEE